MLATVNGEQIFSGLGDVAVDADLVRALGGDDAAVAALERGDILLFGDSDADGDTVRDAFQTASIGDIAFDATVVDVPPAGSLPSVVATSDTLQRLAGDAEVVAKPLWG